MVEGGVATRGEIAVTGKPRQVVEPAAGDERDTEHGGVRRVTRRIERANAVEVPTLRQVGIRVTGLRDGEIPSNLAEGRPISRSLEPETGRGVGVVAFPAERDVEVRGIHLLDTGHAESARLSSRQSRFVRSEL